MSISPVLIIDNRTAGPVEAVLHAGLRPETLFEVEAVWGPVRLGEVRRLLAEGTRLERIPQHFHWNWGAKSTRLGEADTQCLGVECDGGTQGLMMVTTAGHAARLAPGAGEPLVYIDYLEVAPWNVRLFTDSPRYGAVGVRLVEAAVRLSIEVGCGGRVGLHALPQAERFYREACGMECLGTGPHDHGLPYYEFTGDGSQRFLGRGG